MKNIGLKEAFKRIEEYEDDMISIRRHLHANPEISYKESKTAKFIENFYKDLDIDHIETGIGGENGIVVTIKGDGDGPVIGLRADFDALPIQEETGLPYASKNPGVMHACGHDGHTAYMMTLARVLAERKSELKGTVKIIHQPAEEKIPGGAVTIINSGVIDDLDYIFGIHIMADMETSKIFYRPGAIQSGNGYFGLKIKGRGGHGAIPNQANDPIVAGASFVMNVQTIVSRRLSPFNMGVVTIGSFDGKGTDNIIKDSVFIEGNIRAMTDEDKAVIEKNVKMLVKGLETSFGVETELDYQNNHPPVVNDGPVTLEMAEVLKAADIKESAGVEMTPPIAPSEDFSNYLKKIRGSFFFVGCMPRDGKFFPHHHPKFIIDEGSLIVAAKAMVAIVYHYCGKEE